MNTENEIAQSAEMCVIGAIIIEEKSLLQVVDIIKAEDFYFAELKACYEAILELSRNSKPIDFVTVPDDSRTKRRKNLDFSARALKF